MKSLLFTLISGVIVVILTAVRSVKKIFTCRSCCENRPKRADEETRQYEADSY